MAPKLVLSPPASKPVSLTSLPPSEKSPPQPLFGQPRLTVFSRSTWQAGQRAWWSFLMSFFGGFLPPESLCRLLIDSCRPGERRQGKRQSGLHSGLDTGSLRQLSWKFLDMEVRARSSEGNSLDKGVDRPRLAVFLACAYKPEKRCGFVV